MIASTNQFRAVCSRLFICMMPTMLITARTMAATPMFVSKDERQHSDRERVDQTDESLDGQCFASGPRFAAEDGLLPQSRGHEEQADQRRRGRGQCREVKGQTCRAPCEAQFAWSGVNVNQDKPVMAARAPGRCLPSGLRRLSWRCSLKRPSAGGVPRTRCSDASRSTVGCAGGQRHRVLLLGVDIATLAPA